MSSVFDSIVMNAIKNRDKSLETIDALKKQITPYANKNQLKETFDSIIQEDSDYVRRYLKNSSNIAYQKDFYIETAEIKNAYWYRADFNNDSVFLNYGNGDKLLFVCTDKALTSENYNYWTDIFVNGIKIQKENYIEMPSNKVYNFTTGCRRFLVDESLIKVGDNVSIVIHKEPKMDSYYVSFVMNNTTLEGKVRNKCLTFNKAKVGHYGEIIGSQNNDYDTLENLLVFKKSALELDDNFFALNTKAVVKDYFPLIDNLRLKGEIGLVNTGADLQNLPTENIRLHDSYKVKSDGKYYNFDCKVGDILYALKDSNNVDDENVWGWIPNNYKDLLILDLTEDTINKGDIYLVINRQKHIECRYVNKTTLTGEEYIQYDASKFLKLPLENDEIKIHNCNLPLPVKSINDIEIYLDGYRLVNGKDFIFVNDSKNRQYVRFSGILKPNSVINYRNKNIDNSFNFYKKTNLEEVGSQYVCFNDEFRSYIRDESIPNYTDVLVLDDVDLIQYDESYEVWNDRYGQKQYVMYSLAKDTDNAREAMQRKYELNSYQKYASCNLDGVDYLVFDEAMLPDDNIEVVKNGDRFMAFDSFVQDLVAEGKIKVKGIKCFDEVMFTKFYDEYAEIIDREGIFFLKNDPNILNKFSFGIVDLGDKDMPICEDYIEAYLGRIRVPLAKKRSIINRYLKIDDQHITLNDAEIYSDVNFSDYAISTLKMLKDRTEAKENIYSQLKDIDINNELADNWLTITKDDAINTNHNKANLSDIYFGRFQKIVLYTPDSSDQKVKQNVYPNLCVKAYYNDVDSIDVTEYCNFKFTNDDGVELPDFDTHTIGKQYVVATFDVYADDDKIQTLTSDSITLEVVEIEVESIKIVTTTNFFTTTDNYLDHMKVLARYENGDEQVITNKCEIYLSNYDGTVNYKDISKAGSYVINAVYNKDIRDTHTIVVADANERRIKHLDIINNSHLEDNEIITTFDIYATYNNDQIQKVNPDTVTAYLIDTESDTSKIYSNITNIHGLELNKDYTFRFYVYTDETKKTVIETITENYIEKTIRLLTNDVKKNNQIIYYDNNMSYLDEDFINKYSNDPDYYWYSVKTLDGIQLSLGQSEINNLEGIMTVSSVGLNEVVAIEFFNKDTNDFTSQLLFLVRDIDDSHITNTAVLSGNIMDGWTVAINKLDLNENYGDVDFTDSCIKDENGNVIVRYRSDNVNTYNNFTEDQNNYILVHFTNSRTNTGNIEALNRYFQTRRAAGKLDLGLVFEIERSNKILELKALEGTYVNSELESYEYEPITIKKISIDNETYDDEKWLIIEPAVNDYEVSQIYEIRPEASRPAIITNNGVDIRIQLRKNKEDYETTFDVLRCGLNRYAYRLVNEKIYTIEMNLIRKNNVAVIDTINGIDFKELLKD